MKKFKEAIGFIKYNLNTLIGFELFYKIISMLIFSPLFINLFNLIMKITGYKYLTYENLFKFLFNPFSLILLVILILLLLVYTMFDITAIIVILDRSYHHIKITIKETITISLLKVKTIFNLKNILLAFFALIMIPFLNFGLSTSFISSLKIPEFITKYINSNNTLFYIFNTVLIILFTILIRSIYSLHYVILENKSFKIARKKSINLIKSNYIKDIIVLIFFSFFTTILYLLFVFSGVLIIILISKLKIFVLIKSLTTTLISLFLILSIIIFSLLSTPINYAVISSLFYQHKLEKKETIIELKYNKKEEDKISNKLIKYMIPAVSVIILLVGTMFTYGMYEGYYDLNIEHIRTLSITAHRGASLYCPENTMEAFIKAKELGADVIELDVQQTLDKKIIVIHDTNLKRITGVDKYVYQLEYKDIKALDAGSFFNSKFKNSKIPLFDDVVKWAKANNMKLNVELKPTGKEDNFEKHVIDIIKKYNFENKVVITSQVYNVLENVKAYNKEITTIYVMSLAYGDILKLDKADHFSVEASSVNKNLVSKIHKEGKEIYVWTINTKENIKKMIDLNVDNIITDDITLAKKTVNESKNTSLIGEFIKVVYKMF